MGYIPSSFFSSPLQAIIPRKKGTGMQKILAIINALRMQGEVRIRRISIEWLKGIAKRKKKWLLTDSSFFIMII
jgi:hypothetical protein